MNSFRDKHHNKIKELGYWDTPREKGTLLMLMVTEIAKLMDNDRMNKSEKLADLALRIFDYCGYYGIDMSDLPAISKCQLKDMVIELANELESDRVGMEVVFGDGIKNCLSMAYEYARERRVDLSFEIMKKYKILENIKKRKY